MKSFYVSKRYLALFFFISLILFIFASFWYFILWLGLFFLCVICFRKTIIDYRDFLGRDRKILYTPVSGKLLKFDQEKNEMLFKIPFWGPYGVFLPAPAEVVSVEEKMKVTWPFKRVRIKIILKVLPHHQIVVKLYSCYIFFTPKIWVQAGDKGRLAANIGFLPFGGKVKINLTSAGEAQINHRQWVFVGRTLIASLKD